MVTGSVASSAQGEPRSTHDIDLVVLFPQTATQALVEAFPPPEFYVSADSAQEAIRRSSMFNLLWIDTGDKVDFWILKDSPFDRSRFARRKSQTIQGLNLVVSTPEDTILAKLKWCQKSGGSEKQFVDALRVYEVQFGSLDERYIEEWVATLRLNDLWTQLTSQAELD